MNFYRSIALASVSVLSLSSPAFAQAADEANPDADKEIVVTGTNIRGQAPVGANSVTLTAEKLTETAAQSSNELLASIPQVTNYFNRVPVADLGIAVNQIQVSRPNIRNLASPNASASPTLILVDGHRIATAGVNQASVDPDLVPTGAIARVEVLTEGGSAIYGADAVAGVINFVTHKRFDGLKVDGHYGVADKYWQWDASATAGKTFDSGSVWVSYSYTKNDALYGADRDFIHNLDYSALPYRGRDINCNPSNLVLNTQIGTTVIGTNAVTNNRCDNSQTSTVVPRAERHGVMAGLDWDLGPDTSVTARAYWGQRKTRASGDFNGSVTVSAANPYLAGSLPAGLVVGPIGNCIPGLPFPCTNVLAANFNLRAFTGPDAATSSTRIREWGANMEVKHDLGDNWQVRLLGNWSESDSSYDLINLSQVRLNAAGVASTTATAFNPINVTNNNAALIKDLTDNEIAGQAKDHLLNFRAIAEGKLFELPAGDVRVAAGYEFTRDKLEQRFASDIRVGTLGTLPLTPYSRNVHSLFGELVLPVLKNSEGGQLLVVSAQGRYDHYSDFGDTFNPKIGATLRPASWIAFRGNWGTSFTAPTPIDQLGALRNTISQFGFVAFQKPGTTLLSGNNFTIALQGSTPNLKPQTADTWSVGVDLDPMEGLHVSANYYDVNFKDILGTPTPGVGIFTAFPNNVAYDVNGLSTSAVNTFFGQPTLPASLQTQLANALSAASAGRVVELVDFRTGNFGIVHAKGVDFAMNFRQKTGFGGFDLGMNFNATLSRKGQASPTSPVVDQLVIDASKMQLQGVAGLDVGALRAQATWNHNSGYAISPTSSTPVQSKVGAFNTVDLFFKYDVPADGMFKDLSFTLNVKNAFDQDPPVLLRNGQAELGYANGFTLGRMFVFGLSKKF